MTWSRQTDSWGPHTSLRWQTLLSMSHSLRPSEHQTAEVNLEASQCPVFHLICRESVMYLFVFFGPESQIICFVFKIKVRGVITFTGVLTCSPIGFDLVYKSCGVVWSIINGLIQLIWPVVKQLQPNWEAGAHYLYFMSILAVTCR